MATEVVGGVQYTLLPYKALWGEYQKRRNKRKVKTEFVFCTEVNDRENKGITITENSLLTITTLAKRNCIRFYT